MRNSRRVAWLTGWLLLPVAAGAADSAGPEMPQPVSFRIDVMAALSKVGCNMGVCHGNKNGKGGFKLSLRGDDPAADFATLTRELAARRGNPLDPDRSLLLQKPLLRVPHEGGRRFSAGSWEHSVLRAWIAAGMPPDPADLPVLRSLRVEPSDQFLTEPERAVALRVTAGFSDGSTRDVTRQAAYELSQPIADVDAAGLVQGRDEGETVVLVRYLDRQTAARLAFLPARPDFTWRGPAPTNVVDRHVFDKLSRLRINPAPLCTDETFVRRAHLDLLGLLPTADAARRFVADRAPGKRAALIDELLDRPEFAEWWALKWSDLLRNEEKTLDRKGVQNFHAWIRRSIARGQPLNEFARELLAARGSTYSSPAANYWRAMREPLLRAESAAQVFLGVRLQCAKCHNHPFDRWTQDDYYGWASLFARVEYRIVENRRRDSNDSHEFDGEQIVYMARRGEVNDPRTGRPAPARFLTAEAGSLPPETDRLLALADWMAGDNNEQFARAQVNRIWAQLLGRGIVEPVDDFRETNPPVSPPLLAALTREFLERRCDLRALVRTIMNSHTYQAASATGALGDVGQANFAESLGRRLPSEALLDALAQVCEVPLSFGGYPAGLRAGEIPGVRALRDREARSTPAEQFLRLFGKPERLQACECERSGEPTLSQTFQLVSGPLLNDLLNRPDNRLGRLIRAGVPSAQMIDELFWSALSRAPTAEEQSAALAHLARAESLRSGLEDLLWGLVNADEFLLRR